MSETETPPPPGTNDNDDTSLFLKELVGGGFCNSTRETIMNDVLRMWKRKKSFKPKVTLPQQLHVAYKVLVEKYMTNIQNATKDVSTTMEHIATVIRFVLLLFEYMDDQQQKKSSNDTLNVGQVNKMAITLLQKLANAIKSVTISTANDVADKTHDTSLVTCCALGSLLRAINPCVATRPFLLSPLWKGICDMASTLQQQGTLIPLLLANEVLYALQTYVHQGVTQIAQQPQQNSQPQEQYQIKILSFLVGRVNVLFPVILNNTDEDPHGGCTKIMSDITTVLLYLRGLTSVVTKQSTANIQQYQQLGKKVESSLVKIVTSKKQTTNTMFQDKALEILLQTKASMDDVSTFGLGKLLVLRELLEQTKGQRSQDCNPEMVSPLLAIVEEIIFSTLPQCHGHLQLLEEQAEASPSLLSKTIQSLAAAIFTCDLYTKPCNRIQLYGLLVRWLAPEPSNKQQQMSSLHPLTREAAVSLVCCHVLGLHQLSRQQQSLSPRSVDMSAAPSNDFMPNTAVPAETPLLSLLVKLGLDPRTQTGHRRNLVGVLIRIMNLCPSNENDNGSSHLQHPRLRTQQLVATELKRRIQPEYSDHATKKRKLQPNWSRPTVNYKWLSVCSTEDAYIICRLVEKISVELLPALLKDQRVFCQDVLQRNSGPIVCSVGDRPSVVTCFLLSTLLAILNHPPQKDSANSSTNAAEYFCSITDTSLEQFRDSLVSWITSQLRSITKEQKRLNGVQAMTLSNALRLVTFCLREVRDGCPIDKVPYFGELLRRCVSCFVQDNPSKSDTDAEMTVVFELIALLGEIGSSLSTSCPNRILQVISQTFMASFETKRWPIVSSTMTSLVRFASTLPSNYQQILPQCLPVSQQQLMQCRLQGVAYKADDAFQGQDWKSFHQYCSKLLLKLTVGSSFRRPMFPTNSDFEIQQGSYVLKLPTRHDRSALVIFPPGNNSIADIANMLGEEAATTNLHSLQRVMLNGRGCRLLVKDETGKEKDVTNTKE